MSGREFGLRRRALLLTAVVGLTTCEGNCAETIVPSAPCTAASWRVTKESSTDNQIGEVGTALPRALQVTVTCLDSDNSSMVPTGLEATVEWRVVSGGGTLNNGSADTVTSGIDPITGNAQMAWRLGSEVGTQTVRVTASNVFATFSATAAAAVPTGVCASGSATVVKDASTDNQRGEVGTALALPLRVTVRCRDSGNNSSIVPTGTVSWRVDSGGGTLNNGSAVTASSPIDPSTGNAQMAWRLGSAVGTQTVGLSTQGAAQGATAAFTATAVAAPGTAPARFGYATNGEANTVSAYTINQTTGALTPVLPAVMTGTNPRAIAVDSLGRFAYTANYGADSVSAFRIDQTTGALSLVGAVAADGPQSVTVHPNRRFLYVTNRDADSVTAFRIDQTSGALTKVDTDAAGDVPIEIRVHPNGRFAYVCNNGTSNVTTYSIDQNTGALAEVGTEIATGGNGVVWITIDPAGRFAYVVNEAGSITIFSIDQNLGTLSVVSRPAMPPGLAPHALALTPNGAWAYVVGHTINDIVTLRVDPSAGELNVANTLTVAGMSSFGLTADPSGRFVYVANLAGRVATFEINATSGALTAVGEVAAGVGTNSVAVPGGR